MRSPWIKALLLPVGVALGMGIGSIGQIPVLEAAAFGQLGPVSTAEKPNSADPAAVNQIFVKIAKNTVPSVVNISTSKMVRPPRWRGGGGRGAQEDFDQRFFGDLFGMPEQGPSRAASLGSGFVIEVTDSMIGKREALILTNYHVIDGADEVKIKFTESDDEKETEAEIVGADPDLDVALLRVKTDRPLKALTWGDSDRIETGEWIAAVGNPFGHGHSISHGIVSAKARTLPGGFGKYLQVDAPINPGNSGGPLVNLNGEVVGINNAIDARAAGIGFAIPANAAKAIVAQLKSDGKVERGQIGLNVGELQPRLAQQLKLEPNLQAPIVTDVVPSLPADKAGIKPYDVILQVENQKVRSAAELVSAIRSTPVGRQVKIKVLRGGKEKEFSVTVSKRAVAT